MQCTGQPGQCGSAAPICDGATNMCVECLGANDCADSARPLCDGNNQCVTCTPTQGCSGATPLCDASAPGGRCVACLNDAHCGGATPVCNPATQRCVQCVDTGQCNAPSVCDLSTNNCVGCVNDADCSTAAPFCQSSTCLQCRSGADCQNPTPICDATACRACSVGGNECGAGAYCPNGSCKTIPDTCATAESLTFAPGSNTLTFTADTRLAHDDLDGTCNPNARGAEMVYRLNLPTAHDVVVTAVRASGSDANPDIYARFGAANCGVPELSTYCGDTDTGGSETLRIMNRSGDVYLFIESYGATPGPINVTVTLEDPTVVPPNDACGTAKTLTFDASGVATEHGNTTLASNNNLSGDASPSCSTSARRNGRDVVYRMVLESPQDALITVSPEGSSMLLPAVYLRRAGACASSASADELSCETVSTFNPRTVRVSHRNLPAGEYFIWVDGASESAGRFTLTVRTTTPLPVPAHDECAGAEPLTFVGGVAAVTGNTTGAYNSQDLLDGSPSCSSSARGIGGYDVVYTFQLNQVQDVVVELTPTGTSPGLQPVVYLRPLSACASSSSNDEISCSLGAGAGMPVYQRLASMAPGAYALWVDSASANIGPFQLAVRLEPSQPLPANDVCSGAQPLSFTGDVSSVTGSTGSASNSQNGTTNTGPTCSSGAGSQGRDVVYSFVSPVAGQASIVLAPDPASTAFRPVVYVRGACETNSTSDELVCKEAGMAGKVVSVTTPTLVAGRPYFVYVDGARISGGGFRMDTRLGAPPNDTCATARMIDLTTPSVDNRILDITRLSVNDYGTSSPNPLPASCGNPSPGKDLVFLFIAPQTRSYTATLQPDSVFDAVLFRMEGSCAPASCVAGVNKGSTGNPEVMTFSATAGATYWFVVDGYSSFSEGGGFSFKIE